MASCGTLRKSSGSDRRRPLRAALRARRGREGRNALPRNDKRGRKDGVQSAGVRLRFGCRIKAGGCKRRPPIHSSPQCGLRSGAFDILAFSALGTPVWGIPRLRVHRPPVKRPQIQAFGGEPPGIRIYAAEKQNAAGSGGICGWSIRLIFTCFRQQLYELCRGVHRDRRFAVVLRVPRHDTVNAGARRRLNHHGILKIGNLR